MEYERIQAEMIYLARLDTLRNNNIEYEEKHEQLSNEILERHEAIDLLDLLDGLHDFIINENGFDFEEE